MKFRALCAAAAIGLAVSFGAVSAQADTPKDMVVIAGDISDIVSLDPAEAYEFQSTETVANVYDRLVHFVGDEAKPGLAESWTISDDGKVFTFKIRDGVKFHSGNPVTADDIAWSLQRVVKLNKGPAFILTGFGLTPENVEQKVRAEGDTVVFETDKRYAPSFVLNCLGSWVSSAVDKQLALQNEKDGDMGNGWLKTNAAGSGPFKLTSYKPNELILHDRNDDHWQGPAKMKRVALRHVPESSARRLMVEKGDADIARQLLPDEIEAMASNKDVSIRKVPQGAIYYLGFSQKHEALSKPEVREAMKWLVDYDSIEKNILRGTKVVHQSFLPSGFLGAITDKPYKYDVEKAKALLAKAGYPNGFKVTMDVASTAPTPDVAQAIQAMWAKGGVELEIIPGDFKQTLTKYRARQHDIYIGRWSPDYMDPHSNAQGFAWNPDNSDESSNKLLAWRNAWDIPEMTRAVDVALEEKDAAVRRAAYETMQREHQKTSPFVIMFQDVHVVAERNGVSGFDVGPINDLTTYRNITKN